MYSIELQIFFYEYQNKNHKIIILPKARADKTGFYRIIFHFDIRGELSKIRCDKYIYYTPLSTPASVSLNIISLTSMCAGQLSTKIQVFTTSEP